MIQINICYFNRYGIIYLFILFLEYFLKENFYDFFEHKQVIIAVRTKIKKREAKQECQSLKSYGKHDELVDATATNFVAALHGETKFFLFGIVFYH